MAAYISRFSITTNFLKPSTRTTILRHNFTSNRSRNFTFYHQIKRFKMYWPYLGLFTAGSLGYGLYKLNSSTTKALKIPSVYAKNIESDNLPPSRRLNFIADAVEAVQPAVVCIEIFDGRVSRFWGHPATATSSGSGFFVTEEGLVLTNAHVVANANDVKVKLRDGREYKGVVVDLDPIKDLAAIKLNAPQGSKFPTIKLGSSSSLRPGEWVIALGSPLRLSNTITAGIVSAVHRGSKELGLHNDMEYIQTDAAINVGNSGGPLVNLDGEVIGISVLAVAFASGISFAIPIDAVKEFLEGANNRKTFSRSGPNQRVLRPDQRWYMGISMLTLSPQILEELQRRDSNFEKLNGGVLVAGVNYKSPAHVAGLRSGDVITKINGHKIATAKEVFEFVKKGEPLKMDIQRGSKTVSLTVQPQVVG